MSENNIDDVLANGAASLVSNFINENLISKSRLSMVGETNNNESSILLDKNDEEECRDCGSPGSVSIITLSSDSEHDNQDEVLNEVSSNKKYYSNYS
jgi:hypothetical protein